MGKKGQKRGDCGSVGASKSEGSPENVPDNQSTGIQPPVDLSVIVSEVPAAVSCNAALPTEAKSPEDNSDGSDLDDVSDELRRKRARKRARIHHFLFTTDH